MLIGALEDWLYAYYQLLRFVVFGVSVYVAFLAYNWKKLYATWLFGLLAVLFNPLVPIHLSRELWQPIDLICGIVYVVAAFVLKEPDSSSRKDGHTLNTLKISEQNLSIGQNRPDNNSDLMILGGVLMCLLYWHLFWYLYETNDTFRLLCIFFEAIFAPN